MQWFMFHGTSQCHLYVCSFFDGNHNNHNREDEQERINLYTQAGYL